MRSLSVKRGFTLIELLVVIAIIAILASILFPVFSKAREKARQTQCTSNVRQLAMTVQMFVQDNDGNLPGKDWVTDLDTYGLSSKIYKCPSDRTNDKDSPVSYAYSGLLIRPSGKGVTESDINNSSEVGCLADSTPAFSFGSNEPQRLINGGGLVADMNSVGTLDPRHSSGVVVGFVDGHAKYLPGKPIDRDLSSEANRAFVNANSYALVNNPAGGAIMPAVDSDAELILGGTTTIGGDSCTRPVLEAAADYWASYSAKRGSYAPTTPWNYIARFKGMNNTATLGANYVKGCGDGGVISGIPADSIPLGTDAMVVIVAKGTKIPVQTSQTNYDSTAWPTSSTVWPAPVLKVGTDYAVNSAAVQYMYTGYIQGYSATAFHCYTYDRYSGSRAFFANRFGIDDSLASTAPIGPLCTVAADDLDMVDKVAGDPYGIGYCSSAVADPNRVIILGIATDDNPANNRYYPNTSTKNRWLMNEDYLTFSNGTTGWPLGRELYATYAQNVAAGNYFVYAGAPGALTGSSAFVNYMLVKDAGGQVALSTMPIYQTAIWKP